MPLLYKCNYVKCYMLDKDWKTTHRNVNKGIKVTTFKHV